MNEIRCICDSSFLSEQPLQIAEVKTKYGWDMVWDTSNGLEPVWMCPSCATKAKGLLTQLQDLFKVPVTRLNFLPLLKRPTATSES